MNGRTTGRRARFWSFAVAASFLLLGACGDPPARQSAGPVETADAPGKAVADLAAPAARSADESAQPERTAAAVAGAPTADSQTSAGPPPISLRARIVGSDGRLLVGESLLAQSFVDGKRVGAGQTIVGDGDGRFAWALDGAVSATAAPSIGALELRLVHASAPPSRREGARFAIADLAVGTNDLGDLRLNGPEPLLGGRVLDAAGEPVPGALLALEPSAGAGQAFDLVGSDDFGQFQFQGELPLGDWALVARAAGTGAARMDPAPVGHMDIELVLGPGASLAGSLVQDEGAPPLVLRLEATDRGGLVLAHTVVHLRGQPAPFRLDGVPAGEVQLAVLDPGRFALGSVGSVDVPTEGVVELGALPVPGAPRQVRFAVTALGGDPLESLTVRPTQGAGGVTWPSGEGTLVLPREGAALLLSSPGYLTEELEVAPAADGVAPVATAELVPATPSRFQMGGGPLPPGCDLGFALSAGGEAPGEPHWFEGASAVELAAPFTGAGTVHTWLAYETRFERRIVELAPRPVQVAEGGTTLSLAPSADELAAALARLFADDGSSR
ncbi:MAG: hypothetical protein GC161_05630 [Planctomycetaceae bacterium]|nr:hypothetical protein [Planctomycetaceae bacterium]